jgi:hypothetical protein
MELLERVGAPSYLAIVDGGGQDEAWGSVSACGHAVFLVEAPYRRAAILWCA